MFEKKRRLLVDGTFPGKATIVEMTPAKVKGEFTTEDVLAVSRVLIDGTFPDWRRVVPAEPKGPVTASPAVFNPKYLTAWGQIGTEIGRSLNSGYPTLQISLSDGQSPTIVRFSGTPIVFGIQMPMRSEVSGYLPPFMSATEFKQAAE